MNMTRRQIETETDNRKDSLIFMKLHVDCYGT